MAKVHYKVAAEKLKELNVPLAQLDATAEKILSAKYKLTHYPTIYFFRQGVGNTYGGERDQPDAYVDYVLANLTPIITELNTEHEV
jgi:hypothetical protein